MVSILRSYCIEESILTLFQLVIFNKFVSTYNYGEDSIRIVTL